MNWQKKKEDADLEQLEEKKVEVTSDIESAEKKESVDTAQSVEKTTVKTDIDVFDYNQLKNAVMQSNVNINIKNDISFDNPINITGQNITINGDGRKFDLKQTDDTNRFVIKGNADNIEINNLTFDNYYTTGIYISGKNINLKDITLTGKSVEPSKVGNAKAGIDISDANTTVTLENITNQNHLQSGIRVKKGAHITIKGTHIHENDAVDLQSVLDNGVNTNVIDFDNDQYIEYSKNTNQVNYRSKTLNASSFESLKKAVTQSNVNINITSDIKFDNAIDITGKNIIINGDGKTFDLNQPDTTNRFVIKGNADNIEINNLTFDNYTTIGIYVSGKNVALKDITLTGEYKNSTANGKSKVGMDVVGSTVTIENITSKNHSECGIRLREEAKVEISGNNSHENDNADIKMVVLNNASESVITDNTDKYIKTSETIDKDKKIYSIVYVKQ